jgi:RNA polymerase sigma-70 factor (ECF subfamily)
VPAGAFVTTRWTQVLAARDKLAPDGAAALEVLCRAYWYPLYACVRRFGHSPPDAQDLTQEFFARLLARDYLESVDREKGRFRTFLLTALKRFMATEWHRARAQKRGGDRQFQPLDTALAERLYATEPGADLSPDRLYQRRWALTLLDTALARLQSEFVEAGKATEFDALKPLLTADRGEIRYGELAAALRRDEGAARVAVHRFRKRYRELFRDEVAQTVARPADVEDEMRHLMAALA